MAGQWWKLTNEGELQVYNHGIPRNWKYFSKTWIIPEVFDAGPGFIKTRENDEILCVMGKGLMIEEPLEGTEVVLEKYQDDIVSDNNIWAIGKPYKDVAGNPTE